MVKRALPESTAPTLGDSYVAMHADLVARERRFRVAKERSFRHGIVGTLKEAQDALNIAFGAILSAYIGNVLTIIDNKPFNHGDLGFFFVLVGICIGGLCLGNSMLLKTHFALGSIFMGISAASAYLLMSVALSLGFEVAILKVLYICWIATLLVSDVVLTLVIYIHEIDLL